MSDPKYKLVESVGSKLIPVTSYDDSHIHHPSKNAKGLQTGNSVDFEKGRDHTQINGEFEEVRHLNGATFVKKDLIFLENGSGHTNVPAPAAGYVYFDKVDGQANIYDAPKPNGELVARVFHLKPETFAGKNGDHIEYGQPLGIQGQTGKKGTPDPENYGVHAHIEYNIQHLDQFKQYILDINSGVITPEKYPTKNIAPVTDQEYHSTYDIKSEAKPVELTHPQLSKTAQTLITDATTHTKQWVSDNNREWNEQFNQAAHSVAHAAHKEGLTGINLFLVKDGEIHFAQRNHWGTNVASVDAKIASNTDINSNLQAMADIDQTRTHSRLQAQEQSLTQSRGRSI